jgi:ferric-dicitrate binding protein FerR (iron transport regulator)
MKNQKKYHSEHYLSQWISGEISDATLKELVSNEDFEAFVQLEKGISEYSNKLRPSDNAFEKVKKRTFALKKKQKIRTLYTRVALAASILLLLALVVFQPKDTLSYASGFGEHKIIQLPDGSEVILNAKSTLSYSKKSWKKSRSLNLAGEAYFKVKKGSTFKVNTSLGQVTVVGTQFIVNQTADFFDVVCYEGKVRVTTDRDTILLRPHKGYQKINTQTKNYTVLDDKASWLTNNTKFKAVPLKYIILSLEKQFDVVIIANTVNQHVLFTGTIANNNLKTSLEAVFKPLDINYNIEGKTITLK